MEEETIYITEIEGELLSVFVKRVILTNKRIIGIMQALIEKLEKSDATTTPA